MNEDARERYSQRYETWRHLDGLRYQTIQVSLAVFGVTAAILQADFIKQPSWLLMIVGLTMLAQWKLLVKINDAIVANGAALKQFANQVGDPFIPDVSDRAKTFFYWLEIGFLIVGTLLVISSAYILIGHLTDDTGLYKLSSCE